jgi:ribonuclease D
VRAESSTGEPHPERPSPRAVPRASGEDGGAGGDTPVEWIDDPGRLEALVDVLVAEPVWGVDTEFHRERTYFAKLALVQVAWPGGIALVDPLAVDVAPLARALAAPDTTVVAHAADQDLEVLERACGVLPARLFDTQVAAGFTGMSSPSLAALVERYAGQRPPKGDRLTDWLQRPLDVAQRAYAASDVEHLLTLHAALVERLTATGRLRWAEDECERLRLRSRGVADPETAWWRIKEARSLRGRSRAIAQTVAAWRERTAATTDQPVRWVLPDLAVVAIAQRPPHTVDQLRAVRGLDGRFLKGGAGRDILAAVEHGLDRPSAEIRVPPTEDELDRALRPAHSLLSAWLAQRAGELQLDATLLGTRADLQAYLRGDEDARLRHGWRRELVGGALEALLTGEVAVAFERGRGLELVPIRPSASPPHPADSRQPGWSHPRGSPPG